MRASGQTPVEKSPESQAHAPRNATQGTEALTFQTEGKAKPPPSYPSSRRDLWPLAILALPQCPHAKGEGSLSRGQSLQSAARAALVQGTWEESAQETLTLAWCFWSSAMGRAVEFYSKQHEAGKASPLEVVVFITQLE
jgi:hypothetical protein